MTSITKAAEPHLDTICRRAMDMGLEIDLSDCPYGETTGCCAFIKRPASYYFFLAGFVKSLNLTHVLEIGTNFGGSIMSISKGLDGAGIKDSRLVTVDIISKNADGFRKYPHIRRVEGDSLDKEIAKKTIASFDADIDLLYIDSLHEYEHTKENIAVYTRGLNPRYVVLDDIRLCDGMKKLWSELEAEFGDNAFDASDIIKRPGAGFGVIRRRN